MEGKALEAMAKVSKHPDLDRGLPPKHARIMDNVRGLFWCDARDEQGHLQQAPDCEQRECFVVQGKKQETNTGAKAKIWITTGVLSPVPSVGRGSTTRMSATTSSACPRS